MLVLPLMTQAQLNFDSWETVNTVDDSGIETGNQVRIILGKTLPWDTRVFITKVVEDDGRIHITFYDDKGTWTHLGRKEGAVFVERSDGKVEIYKSFTTENSVLYFGKDSDFSKLLKNGKNEKLFITLEEYHPEGYSKFSYVFSLRTQ